MNKKKLCWVTPDAFMDTDFFIVPYLLDVYDITWIILFPWRHVRFKEEDFDDLKKNHQNLKLVFIHNSYRGLDPRTLGMYYKIKKIITQIDPDLIYLNYEPMDPLVLPFYNWLPKYKTITTAHDGCVKSTFSRPWLSERCFNIGYGSRQYVQLYSPEQERIFSIMRPKIKTFVIPLALKNFGKPTKSLRRDCISFVSFGTIHPDKNIGLLIRAAEKLYNDGYRNFKVVIKGTCPSWEEEYNPLIIHSELFETDIRFIRNEEIANIYSENTFGVFPYKQTGQSGAIKVALFYRKPTIVSNLNGFTDDIKNGYNGYVFKSDDVNDLARVMKYCIDTYPSEYKKMVHNVEQFVEKKYAIEKIVDKYLRMFNFVMNNQKS